jgi:hypothetical protein
VNNSAVGAPIKLVFLLLPTKNNEIKTNTTTKTENNRIKTTQNLQQHNKTTERIKMNKQNNE